MQTAFGVAGGEAGTLDDGAPLCTSLSCMYIIKPLEQRKDECKGLYNLSDLIC